MTEVTTNVTENEWRYFLDSCDSTKIYHTPEWRHFLESTFGYEPFYLFSKDGSGYIDGLLPLFYVKSKITGNRLCSVPFSHICGYIGSNDSKDKLINEGIRVYSRLNASYFEVRDLVSLNGFHSKNSFSTYILDLCPDIGEVWSKLEKKSSRWAIKKSEKIGVRIESTTSIEDLKEFYELNCITKRDIGVPCHPWKFFRNMFKYLDGHVSLYIARYNDEIIAGGVFMYCNQDVLYGYGAANPNYLNVHPYNAFIWKSIKDSCVNGYKHFDFGRTSYDNKGLINFKKKWGVNEMRLYYSYYPKNPEPLIENRGKFIYKCGAKAIQKLPQCLYTKVSDFSFRHFG